MDKPDVKKLQLSKETVRVLNDDELRGMAGGTILPTGEECNVFTTANCPTGDCGCMVNTLPILPP